MSATRKCLICGAASLADCAGETDARRTFAEPCGPFVATPPERDAEKAKDAKYLSLDEFEAKYGTIFRLPVRDAGEPVACEKCLTITKRADGSCLLCAARDAWNDCTAAAPDPVRVTEEQRDALVFAVDRLHGDAYQRLANAFGVSPYQMHATMRDNTVRVVNAILAAASKGVGE